MRTNKEWNKVSGLFSHVIGYQLLERPMISTNFGLLFERPLVAENRE